MKIPWKKVFYFVFLLGSMLGFKNAVGQNDSIQKSQNQKIVSKFSISGQILETDNKTTIPFCNIVLIDQNNKQIDGTTSDFDVFFILNNMSEGIYTLNVTFVGFKKYVIENFEVNQNIDFKIILEQSIEDLEKYEMQCYQIPLIDPGRTRSVETFDSDEINRMPLRR